MSRWSRGQGTESGHQARPLLAQREEQRGVRVGEMLLLPGAGCTCTCTCWIWGQPPPGEASIASGGFTQGTPGNFTHFLSPKGSKWLFTPAAFVSACGVRIHCQFTQASWRIHNHQHLFRNANEKVSSVLLCVCLLCLL